jgi:GNAT superfamily N-acetyltransferase
MSDQYIIRPMTGRDIPKLADIRPGFQTDTILRVRKHSSGLHVGWELYEVKLEMPFDKGHGYDFDETERANIRERLAKDNTLMEVAIEPLSNRIVGVLDVERHDWNETAWVWNLMLDYDARRRGLGKRLLDRTIRWTREQGLRAIILETQTNNVPACKFYAAVGFQLVGINEAYYSNHDLQNDEVALFWSYPVR